MSFFYFPPAGGGGTGGEGETYVTTVNGLPGPVVTLTPTTVGAEPANPNIQGHVAATGNPHGATAADVGASPAVHGHNSSEVANVSEVGGANLTEALNALNSKPPLPVPSGPNLILMSSFNDVSGAYEFVETDAVVLSYSVAVDDFGEPLTDDTGEYIYYY
jgi:hypothetical protein